jgi:hypothetical protein
VRFSSSRDATLSSATDAGVTMPLKALGAHHVALRHAHLQLVGGILTLNGFKVIQQAHPYPPVADISIMRFQIQMKELFSRRVVADVILLRPKVHNDQRQLVTEKKDSSPGRWRRRTRSRIEVSQATVAKYMVRKRATPSQNWRTFLRNDAEDIAAIDCSW